MGLVVFICLFISLNAILAADIVKPSKYINYADLYTATDKTNFTEVEISHRKMYCDMRNRFGTYKDLKEYMFCKELIYAYEISNPKYK